MKVSRILAAACCTWMLASSCAGPPGTPLEKQALQQQAQAALDTARLQDPTLATLLDGALAYAVFPKVTKAGAGIGGAFGEGVFFEHGILAGYCQVTQLTIGAQLGAQTYIEVVAFKTPQAVAQFKLSAFSLGAQATAVALQAGAAANAQYSDGIAVLTADASGLMAEASVGGQDFSFQHL